MKIGVAQLNCSLGDVSFNCSQISSYALRAKDRGCTAVIFPEMVDTGYEVTTIQEKASSWNDPPFEIARQAARDGEIYILCGLSEKEGEKIYNSLAAFDPKGDLIGRYRKAHLASYAPLHEDRCFSPGESLETLKIGDMNWGLTICYDLRFPEIHRSLVLKGAEVLVLSSAWPFPRSEHFKTLARARAIENQAYMIVANRVGTDGPVTFCGSSCIVDPYGVIVASAAEDREELIVGEIHKDTVKAVRDKMPVFQHRREDLY